MVYLVVSPHCPPRQASLLPRASQTLRVSQPDGCWLPHVEQVYWRRFPTAFPPFVSLYHILVILTILPTFSFIFVVISVISYVPTTTH